MNKICLTIAMLLCTAAIPASAQFSLESGGGSGPSSLCNSFTSYACLIARAQESSGAALTSYGIEVNGGCCTYTNGGSNPGWIVVISPLNQEDVLIPYGGSCLPFSPGSGGVTPEQNFDSSGWYYTITFTSESC
jgi:hypothetical protein